MPTRARENNYRLHGRSRAAGWQCQIYDAIPVIGPVRRTKKTRTVAMTVSSRTPEGESGRCPICDSPIVVEPSSFLGDATCPNCGHLIWFMRLPDEVHAFNTIDDRVLLRLADYLGRRGFRNTIQRRTLAHLVTAIDSPFSSEQLIAVTRRLPHDRRVTPATVYRTLGEFVDAGILTYSSEGGDRQYVLA